MPYKLILMKDGYILILNFIQSSMSSSTGEFVLGQYRIGKSIGEGTFGKVRLGIHIPTGQKVAVKTLQKEKIVQQADIERVTREICILKILRHPNIIQLYEIIETKTDIHLIMEYAEGGQLFDYIVKKKRLDEKEAVSFMQQILSGVEYIHKNGIVHRDLKPQNLLLDHNKNIKIVDFGLSNQYKPGEKLKTACGSPCYAAPEMIAGKRYQCLGADIWSCGIILYAMLCGYLPFEDPNTSKLYKKIMAGQYETPKILSAESKEVLKGILNTNPQNRFKIDDIRQTKWYKQLPSSYSATGIIVGKDPIEPNDQILRKLQKYSIEMAQARTYIINNRHNQVTAFYYLLKIKSERDPSFQWQDNNSKSEQKTEKREESPLIYRPSQAAKKEYYIPIKKPAPKQNKDNSKNDSMNVSNIISSLVQANKNRIVTNTRFTNTKKETNFDKLQEFKLFPNKKNSSIYEPNTASNAKGGSTSRSHHDQKSLQFNKVQKSVSIDPAQQINRTNISINHGSSLQNTSRYHHDESNINKKRQELSDQLKQISIKIDKQIHDLRKQNNMTGTVTTPTTSVSKKRDSIGPTFTSSSSRPKTQETSISLTMKSNSKDPFSTTKQSQNPSRDHLNLSKDHMNISRDHGSISKEKELVGTGSLSNSKERLSFYRQRQNRQAPPAKGPKVHTGPFNTQCIFMENAKSLYEKIVNLLGKLKLRYQEVDAYSLSMGNQQISIQSVQGISGLHLVKFNAEHPVNQTIIEVLSK